MSHPWLFSHALSPRALPLLHPPFLPQNENTQYIPHISKLHWLTSCAIKNHSGVKTCRVAGNPRTTTPTSSGNPDCGEKGRPRDDETAPIGSAGTPPRGGRTSARARGTGYGTEHPNRAAPGQGGVDSRLAALMRETDRNQVGTEQNEFSETPIGCDGRGHLHDSDGSKAFETTIAGLGSSRRRTIRRILS